MSSTLKMGLMFLDRKFLTSALAKPLDNAKFACTKDTAAVHQPNYKDPINLIVFEVTWSKFFDQNYPKAALKQNCSR